MRKEGRRQEEKMVQMTLDYCFYHEKKISEEKREKIGTIKKKKPGKKYWRKIKQERKETEIYLYISVYLYMSYSYFISTSKLDSAHYSNLGKIYFPFLSLSLFPSSLFQSNP